MIRFIFSVIYLLLYLILTLPLELILFIISRFSRPLCDKICFILVKYVGLGAVTKFSGAKVIVNGLENIPKDTACLFVGNHNSYFDVIISYTLMNRPTGYIAKKEFEKYPSLHAWMSFMRCLFIDRKDIKQGMKTILKAVEYLKEGINIFVFPEGTRSKDGKMLPFKEGSMKMAEKSGCPIVPIAISNTASIFEKHLPRISPEPVVFTFCKPIYTKDLEGDDRKHVGQYVENIIQETLDNVNKPLLM